MFDRSFTPKQLREAHGIRFHHLNALTFRTVVTGEEVSPEVYAALPDFFKGQVRPARGALCATVVTMPVPPVSADPNEPTMFRVAAVFASPKERVVSRALGREEGLRRLEAGLEYIVALRAAREMEEASGNEVQAPIPPRHFITLFEDELKAAFENRTILQHFDGGRRYRLAPSRRQVKFPPIGLSLVAAMNEDEFALEFSEDPNLLAGLDALVDIGEALLEEDPDIFAEELGGEGDTEG